VGSEVGLDVEARRRIICPCWGSNAGCPVRGHTAELPRSDKVIWFLNLGTKIIDTCYRSLLTSFIRFFESRKSSVHMQFYKAYVTFNTIVIAAYLQALINK
jgi:hypothetical protein